MLATAEEKRPMRPNVARSPARIPKTGFVYNALHSLQDKWKEKGERRAEPVRGAPI